MDKNNEKVKNIVISCEVIFYKEPPEPNTFGNNDIAYQIYYHTDTGIMRVFEIGAFGDATLVRSFKDRRDRGITLKEMLENIEEISKMNYKEFKEKILFCEKEVDKNGI